MCFWNKFAGLSMTQNFPVMSRFNVGFLTLTVTTTDMWALLEKIQ